MAEDSEASLWYFAGQRDAGDDPGGDFVIVELSLDGDSTGNPQAEHGDVTVNAIWTEVTANVPAGSRAQFLIQASDGVATSDLVEAGIDDVSICSAGDPGNLPPTAVLRPHLLAQ